MSSLLLTNLQLPSAWANESSEACQPRVLETLLQHFSVLAASSFDGIANQSVKDALLTGVLDSRFNCTKLPMCHVSSLSFYFILLIIDIVTL